MKKMMSLLLMTMLFVLGGCLSDDNKEDEKVLTSEVNLSTFFMEDDGTYEFNMGDNIEVTEVDEALEIKALSFNAEGESDNIIISKSGWNIGNVPSISFKAINPTNNKTQVRINVTDTAGMTKMFFKIMESSEIATIILTEFSETTPDWDGDYGYSQIAVDTKNLSNISFNLWNGDDVVGSTIIIDNLVIKSGSDSETDTDGDNDDDNSSSSEETTDLELTEKTFYPDYNSALATVSYEEGLDVSAVSKGATVGDSALKLTAPLEANWGNFYSKNMNIAFIEPITVSTIKFDVLNPNTDKGIQIRANITDAVNTKTVYFVVDASASDTVEITEDILSLTEDNWGATSGSFGAAIDPAKVTGIYIYFYGETEGSHGESVIIDNFKID